MTVELTARQRARLKARAHSLEPVVQLGQGGLTDALVAEVDRALTAHELIKVRIGGADRHQRAALAAGLCERLAAAEVQRVGRIVVIFRPRPDE